MDKDFSSLNKYILDYIDETKSICDKLDILAIRNLILELNNLKGRLFVLGVGGSAANASHAVNDFRKIKGIETYAITDNVAELTARINDEGWETCFSKWLEISKINKNDAVLVFSVGGGSEKTSQNIAKAVEFAKDRKAKVFSVVSRDGGITKKLSDVCILIPTVNSDRITAHAESFQGIILHLLVNS